MSHSQKGPLRVALAVLFLTLGLACGGHTMGKECESSDQCDPGGTCLDGVCSGYTCAGDDECANDLVCGEVGGASVCVAPCSRDEECLGAQTCHIEDGAEIGVCL